LAYRREEGPSGGVANVRDTATIVPGAAFPVSDSRAIRGNPSRASPAQAGVHLGGAGEAGFASLTPPTPQGPRPRSPGAGRGPGGGRWCGWWRAVTSPSPTGPRPAPGKQEGRRQ
jgi:hypothetical protein